MRGTSRVALCLKRVEITLLTVSLNPDGCKQIAHGLFTLCGVTLSEAREPTMITDNSHLVTIHHSLVQPLSSRAGVASAAHN